jgi:hypothetical protein
VSGEAPVTIIFTWSSTVFLVGELLALNCGVADV